jgi:hypothetical protein
MAEQKEKARVLSALKKEACLDCPVSAVCIAGALPGGNNASKVLLPGGREVVELVWYTRGRERKMRLLDDVETFFFE